MEYKAFKDLTKEERSELMEVILQSEYGSVEFYRESFGEWVVLDSTQIDLDIAYRTKPAKKLNIPWEIIKPEYKWAAMDEDGEVCLYTTKPELGQRYWFFLGDGLVQALSVLDVDTTGISWENSLTQRPE